MTNTEEQQSQEITHGHRFDVINITGPATVQLGDQNTSYHQLATNGGGSSAERYEGLLKSLLFDRIDFRVNNVKKALLSTCEWLYSHPDFQSWFENDTTRDHNGFFWIKGKPGCGKSTLMKAALEYVKKRRKAKHLRQSIVPYFFNARAAASLEKSSLGLYRNLVHHLLSTYPSLQNLFMEKFNTREPGTHGENWTREELQEFLFDTVEHQEKMHLCLFIDALDEAEYEDDVRRMIRFLIELADRAKLAGGSFQLQICVSSRHYPHISIGRGLSLIVEEQPEHKYDIDRYIRGQLTCQDSTEKDLLRSKILQKSASIFLWVVLVVEILNKLDDHGSSLSDMQTRLNSIPAGLNELFQDILLKGENGVETSVLFFQWMLFSLRPLKSTELYVAMEFSRSPLDADWKDPGIKPPTPERLAKYILNYSRGLVELVGTSTDQLPTVQFIHETVREFLLKENGLASIMPALGTKLVGISHEILRVACYRCISAYEIPEDYVMYCTAGHKSNGALDTFKSELLSKMPLLEYAVSHLFRHSDKAMENGISQGKFITTYMNEKGHLVNDYRQWWNVLERYGTRKLKIDCDLLNVVVTLRCSNLIDMFQAAHLSPERRANLLMQLMTNKVTGTVRRLFQTHFSDLAKEQYDHVLSHCVRTYHLIDPIRELLELGAALDVAMDTANSLRYAVDFKRVKAVEILLSYGANANATRPSGRTIILCAIEDGQFPIVELLLKNGANIDHSAINFDDPLGLAIRNHSVEIVRLLLSHGANVNVVWTGGRTPLTQAIDVGREAIVQLLLDHGANVEGDKQKPLVRAAAKGWTRIIQLLLSRGVEINAGERHNGISTALCSAASHGHQDVVKLLLEHNVDIEKGHPLGRAIEAGHIFTARTLLDSGADVQRLFSCENYRLISTSTSLAEASLLYVAAARGRIDMVELLLEYDASTTWTDQEGISVAERARNSGYADIANVIQRHERSHGIVSYLC